MEILVFGGVAATFGLIGGVLGARELGQPFPKCAVISATLIGCGFIAGWFLGGLFGEEGRGVGAVVGVAIAGAVESSVLRPKR